MHEGTPNKSDKVPAAAEENAEAELEERVDLGRRKFLRSAAAIGVAAVGGSLLTSETAEAKERLPIDFDYFMQQTESRDTYEGKLGVCKTLLNQYKSFSTHEAFSTLTEMQKAEVNVRIADVYSEYIQEFVRAHPDIAERAPEQILTALETTTEWLTKAAEYWSVQDGPDAEDNVIKVVKTMLLRGANFTEIGIRESFYTPSQNESWNSLKARSLDLMEKGMQYKEGAYYAGDGIIVFPNHIRMQYVYGYVDMLRMLEGVVLEGRSDEDIAKMVGGMHYTPEEVETWANAVLRGERDIDPERDVAFRTLKEHKVFEVNESGEAVANQNGLMVAPDKRFALLHELVHKVHRRDQREGNEVIDKAADTLYGALSDEDRELFDAFMELAYNNPDEDIWRAEVVAYLSDPTWRELAESYVRVATRGVDLSLEGGEESMYTHRRSAIA